MLSGYGRKPGFVFDMHLSGQHGSYGSIVMSVTNREAHYVLAGPLRHDTELLISTDYTGTGGGEPTSVGAAIRSSKFLTMRYGKTVMANCTCTASQAGDLLTCHEETSLRKTCRTIRFQPGPTRRQLQPSRISVLCESSEGCSMGEYRLYGLDRFNRIYTTSRIVECETDKEASVVAEALLAICPPAEVWQGARCVCRIMRMTQPLSAPSVQRLS